MSWTRTRRLALALIVVAIGAAAGLYLQRHLWTPQNREAAARPSGKRPVLETMGSTTAQIRIRAYYPGNASWTDDTMAALRNLVRDHNRHIHITTIDSTAVAGKDAMAAAGLPECGLEIDGEIHFRRTVMGTEREIHFEGPAGPHWRVADLRAIVETKVADVYGPDAAATTVISGVDRGETFRYGSPEAKVEVIAYYPVPDSCVESTVELLRELGARYQDHVSMRVVDTRSDASVKEWEQADIYCHGTVVAGQQTWTLKRDGRTEEICFFGPLEGSEVSCWTREHLEQAIRVACEKAGIDSRSLTGASGDERAPDEQDASPSAVPSSAAQ